MSEHQRNPHEQMPFRMLEYAVVTMRAHLKQEHKQLPIIVPIVIYNGKEPWKYSTALEDYYANPTLAKEFLYMAPFTLLEVPKMPVDEIYRDPALGFYFEALHATSTQDPYEAFANAMHTPIFKEHFDTLPKEFRVLALSYLGNCISQEEHSLENLINLAAINNQEKEKVMMTIAQAYEQIGEQRGVQQGILFTAKKMLNKACSMDLVSSVTGLSQAELARIAQGG
jgi:predicted transposase YdaD